MGFDRILEVTSVHLDHVRNAGSGERPGQDQRTHHHVVGECDVRLHTGDHVDHRLDVGVDVTTQLCITQGGKWPRVETLVAIGHEHGQHPRNVGPIHGAARRAQTLADELAAVPVAHVSDEIERSGMTVLTTQMHLMAEPHQSAGESGVIDVGACATQQIPVEHQHSHDAEPM